MLSPDRSFADLGLRPVVVHALRRIGVDVPFPIQIAAIPDALAGRDILGYAPTGSGKTLAFGLPVLHRLSGRVSRPSHPRGLILVPTRELALQIDNALSEPALATGMRMAGLVGGVPLKRQIDRIARGVDVVIATPGRLEDLVTAGHLYLDDVAITVVDEADRMSDLGFLPQVQALLDRTPTRGQRMLFSATLDNEVDALVQRYLDRPAHHRAAGSLDAAETGASAAEHHFFRVDPTQKSAVAAAMAAREGRTVMFLRTKHAVDRFTDSLVQVGISAAALHGDKTQASRTRTLAQFADGSVPVLVATDVVARGIDVADVSLVVHVDPPADAKDYTHRAGRTARAGRTGTVVTLVTDGQVDHVCDLAAEAGIHVDVVDVDAASQRLRAATGARTPPGVPATTTPAPPVTNSRKPRPGRRDAVPSTARNRSRKPGRR